MPLRWRKLENFKLELPRDTLLSVEIVQELKGEVRGGIGEFEDLKQTEYGCQYFKLFIIASVSVLASTIISLFVTNCDNQELGHPYSFLQNMIVKIRANSNLDFVTMYMNRHLICCLYTCLVHRAKLSVESMLFMLWMC